MWSLVSSWQNIFGLHLLKQSVFSSDSSVLWISGMSNSCSVRFAFHIRVCLMLYGCQKGTSALFTCSWKTAQLLHVANHHASTKKLQVSFYSMFTGAISSYIHLYVSKPYERPSVDIGGQIGFGLSNNWFAFGGDPDLGFLPLDDYHLVAII